MEKLYGKFFSLVLSGLFFSGVTGSNISEKELEALRVLDSPTVPSDGNSQDIYGDEQGDNEELEGMEEDTLATDADAADMDGDSEGTDGDNDGTDGDTDGTDGDTDGTDGDTDGTVGDNEGEDGDTEVTDEDNEGANGDTNGTDGDTDGTFGDTDGTVGDIDETDGDTEGTVGDTVGEDRNTDGTVGDTDGTDGDTEGTVGDTAREDGDTDGTDGDTDGTVGDTDGTDADTVGENGDTEGTDADTVGTDEDTVGTDGDTDGTDGDTDGTDEDTMATVVDTLATDEEIETLEDEGKNEDTVWLDADGEDTVFLTETAEKRGQDYDEFEILAKTLNNEKNTEGGAGADGLSFQSRRQNSGAHAFQVLRTANQQYYGIDFFVIKARLPADGLSASENWCRDYQRLCAQYGLRPTGCGEHWAINNGNYARCRTEYNSDPYINNVLSCNPSSRIATVANLAFSAGATSSRSFGFHTCGTNNCQRGIVQSRLGLTFTQAAFPNGDRIVYTVCKGSADPHGTTTGVAATQQTTFTQQTTVPQETTFPTTTAGTLQGRDALYLTAYKSWHYYKVPVTGAMTSANVKATCEAAGYVTPCPGDSLSSACRYSSSSCFQTGLICGNPMKEVSQQLCGADPDSCPQMYGVYQFINNWNNGASCGAELRRWCVVGNRQQDKYAFCARDAIGTTSMMTAAQQTTEPTTALGTQQGSSSCAAPLDLFFLLDGSGSVNAANFAKVKQFVVNVVNTFDVSPAATRVGVVQYSDRNTLVFNLGNRVAKSSTLSAINNIPYQGGGTNTGAALHYVRQYASWRGGNVPKVMIVLTDGKSSDSVSGPSQNLVSDGVEVYAIGVGSFDHGQLLQIANNKQNNVIELNNFNALATKIDMISTNVCSYALHTVPTPANELSASTTCTNDYMELSIPEDQLTDINLGNLHWEPDQNCGASTNGTHYIFRTDLYRCGTQVTFGPKYVTFLNTINILGIHLSGGVITREGDISITSKCKYERQEWVDSTFLPIPGGLNFTEEGFGQLEVRLSMFPTRQYLSSYRAGQYPIHLKLRQYIYMQLEVQGHGQNLSVLALNCRATMSPNPNDTLQYPLIKDGCGSDPTLQTYNINDNSKERFGFEAFRFIREVKTVYVHCEVTVCNGADSGSRCAQGCVRRGKRAAEEIVDMKGRHMIYQGPIILDDDNEETVRLMSGQETASGRHSAPWAMLAAGGGLMALALVVMGAAIVLKRSSREELAYQSLPNMAEDGE